MLSGYECRIIVINLLCSMSLQYVEDHGSTQFSSFSILFFFFSLPLLISVLPSIYTNAYKFTEQEIESTNQSSHLHCWLWLKDEKNMLVSTRIRIAKQNSLWRQSWQSVLEKENFCLETVKNAIWNQSTILNMLPWLCSKKRNTHMDINLKE